MNDFNMFDQVKTDPPKLVTLSNRMLLKEIKTDSKNGYTIFKVVLPSGHKPLAYDGTSFYHINNITSLDIGSELVDVKII